MSIIKRKEETLSQNSGKKELLSDYYNALNRINTLKNRFDNITEPALIEACVYELKAAQAEYSHILGKIKNEKIKAEDEKIWRL